MDPKQFRQIIKDELKPLDKKVDKLGRRVGGLEKGVSGLDKRLVKVELGLNSVQAEIKELTENVDAARGDIEGLWHQRDKREIDEIKTRIGLPLMSDTPTI